MAAARRRPPWTDSDVLWLLEAAGVSARWMDNPPAHASKDPLGPEFLALCWEAARRDLIQARTPKRRAILRQFSRRLVLDKIHLDVQPGGPVAPKPPFDQKAVATAKAALRKVAARYGSDSVVVARAEAVIHAAEVA